MSAGAASLQEKLNKGLNQKGMFHGLKAKFGKSTNKAALQAATPPASPQVPEIAPIIPIAALNQVGDTFKMLEENTGVQRIYLAYGIAGAIVLWLAFGWGAQLVANTVGFLYPAYCSIKALESHAKSDDTQWLTYWVVFAAFSVVEYFADFIAGWVPFYWLSKCLFLVWCMAPMENNGANIIYQKVILPMFLKHEGEIDAALARAQGKAGDFLDRVTEKAKDMAAEHQLNKSHDE